ncbi:MAG: tetratricopeptide repeat protein [Candidatus Competibacter sp.]
MGWWLHGRLGRYDEAEAAYRQAIALDPKFALPWNDLGILLQDHLARYEEAEAAYRQAIALDSNVRLASGTTWATC